MAAASTNLSTNSALERTPVSEQYPLVADTQARSSSLSTRTRRDLTVLGICVLPVALTPYLIMRTRVSSLRKLVEESKLATQRVQNELRVALLSNATRKEEDQRLRSLVSEIKQQLTLLRADTINRQREQAALEILVKSAVSSMKEEKSK